MMSEKQYVKALTIEHAISEAIKNFESFRFIAGGTDVFPNKYQDNDRSNCLIDISNIDELKGIKHSEKYLTIGSLTCLDDLKNNEFIAENLPVLIEAANSVASPIIRKTATIGGNLLCENRCHFYNQSNWWKEAAGQCLKSGGNICIANGGKKNCFSKFVSDTAIALISLNAKVEVITNNKIEIIPIEEIYSGDGITPLKLDKTILIKSIQIPLNLIKNSVFKKLRQRKSIEFSSLTTCTTIFKNGEIKIALGAISTKPIVVEGKINENYSELINLAITNSRIVDNDCFSKTYRKNMITVFLNRSLKELKLI